MHMVKRQMSINMEQVDRLPLVKIKHDKSRDTI